MYIYIHTYIHTYISACVCVCVYLKYIILQGNAKKYVDINASDASKKKKKAARNGKKQNKKQTSDKNDSLSIEAKKDAEFSALNDYALQVTFCFSTI